MFEKKCQLKVQTKAGVQFVTTNITQRTSPIPNITDAGFLLEHKSDAMLDFWRQLSSVSYATRELFLGTAFESINYWEDTRPAGQPSFLEVNGQFYSWGDVLNGIEEMSHNVTAALLTLSLGTMPANCSFDQVVGYQYTPMALWVPYGVSNFSLFSSYDLTFSPLCFIDGLGHCFDFTRCCRPDNGEK